MTTFTILFAIQQHSWTIQVWIGESLKHLYEQLSGFCFQYASIDFQLKSCFAWLYRVSKFCSVHSPRERLLAANKRPQRSQIPLEQNRTFTAQKSGQGGLFLNAAINQKMQNKKVRVIGTLQCNWRQISPPFFLSLLIPLRLKNPRWANKQYIVQNQIFDRFFFWRLINGHFENVPIKVAWYDTSQVCKAVERVMLTPESNNSALAVQLVTL